MSQILDGFFAKASKACIPLVTTFEITQGCNYKCHHCYNFDRSKESINEAKAEPLKPDEILRIIDELGHAGALYLNFTGGEVLLHPHLDEFIRRARLHHMEARLKTNGSLLTIERCQKLNHAGLAGMDISLYGFSEASYQKLTGKSGMFSRTLNGIKAAKELGFDINISIILHRYNIEEMKEMIHFCQNLELSFRFSTEITERYDGSSGAREFEITSEQFLQGLKGEFSDVFMHLNPDRSLQCSCARTVCGISFSGEVYPCIGAPIASGNLRDKKFQDIWDNSKTLNDIRGIKSSDFKACQSCQYIEYCNRSSGSIYTNTKNYTGCDSMTLKQAELRYNYHNRLS